MVEDNQFKSDKIRSLFFDKIIARRKDEKQRQLIEKHAGELDFGSLGELAISKSAWRHVEACGAKPQMVFAHPDMLQAHPTVSLHYRGMSLLSQKRVGRVANVKPWEDGTLKKKPTRDIALKVARLYNSVISSIIENSPNWKLEDGYRNVIASMGISIDGTYRNEIGKDAEAVIRDRVLSWLKNNGHIVDEKEDKREYLLKNNVVMKFGSEPDISFSRAGELVATVEVKGGNDPAGGIRKIGSNE